MAERNELRARVWQAISKLGDTHREILVLRDFHDLAYREISDVLSIPLGTVMSRLHAARKKLREILVAGEPMTASVTDPSGVGRPRRNEP
jgi:RNA polymerase sigma-70 factor (ECF subfamily)